MNGINAFCVNMKSGSLVVADKAKGNMSIFPAGAKNPVFKLNSVFDIIALRDLLNDVYPQDVYKR